mmetsp:Transcript_61097/g.180731  ORF Transcript_61097/g.180731 Transcript_61097/m.180731 type:complete len:80 (-) Transcript_61097:391-630(-)
MFRSKSFVETAIFVLKIGEIIITSCPKDKVLKILVPNDGTDNDCNFLNNAVFNIVTQSQFKDKPSLDAQMVKGAELLCD